MNDNYEKFWTVCRHNCVSAQAQSYSNREDAITEANRLANAAGDPYYVLEVVGIVKPIPIPYDFTAI